MLSIVAPTLPSLPQMEDGSPFPVSPPLDLQNTVSIPDGDGAAFVNAVNSAQPGTTIEIGADITLRNFDFSKAQNRHTGWVTIRPKPALMAAIDAKIGDRRIRDEDFGILPTLHATADNDHAFIFGPRRNSDVFPGPGPTGRHNLWFHRIGFNLQHSNVYSHYGILAHGDGMAFTQCMGTRRPKATPGTKLGWIQDDAYDHFIDRSWFGDCANNFDGETQCLNAFSRTTRLWLNNSYFGPATEAVFIGGYALVTGNNKTTEDVTITGCVMGDHYAFDINDPSLWRAKCVFETKSCRRLAMQRNIVGPMRGTINGGQIARFTVSRSLDQNAVGLDWLIENNWFHDSPAELQLLLPYKFADSGPLPHGLRRVRFANNVLTNINTTRKFPPIQLTSAQWQTIYPQNNAGDIEIVNNISYHTGAGFSPRGFVMLTAGGFDVSSPQCPGPLRVADNIVDCGGQFPMWATEFNPTKGQGDDALKAAIGTAEWEHNAHVGARLTGTNHSATNVTVPDLSGIKFTDIESLDFSLMPGSAADGRGSRGGDIGLNDPSVWRSQISDTEAGVAISSPAPTTPPPVDLPPIVRITSPRSGATVDLKDSSTVGIWYELTDDVSLATIKMMLDGGTVFTDDFSGGETIKAGAFSVPLRTTGTAVITVIATDSAGNTGSASITLNVVDTTTPPAPEPTINERLETLEASITHLVTVVTNDHIRLLQLDTAVGNAEAELNSSSDRIMSLENKLKASSEHLAELSRELLE